MHPPMGLPLPMPRGGPMDGHYRFHSQGPVMMPGGQLGMARPPMQITLGARGPAPGGPMMLGRMPGPHQQGVHPQHSVVVMQQPQRPGVPPGANGSHMIRQPMRPGAPGTSWNLESSMANCSLHCSRCTGVVQFDADDAWSTSTWLLSWSTSPWSRSK